MATETEHETRRVIRAIVVTEDAIYMAFCLAAILFGTYLIITNRVTIHQQ